MSMRPVRWGATLNDTTIPQLKATIIAGAANNQLQAAQHGDRLHEKGILYVPDYVINAGGMINAAGDIHGNYNREAAHEKTLAIYDTLMEVFAKSQQHNRPTYMVADEIAETLLQSSTVESAVGD